MDFLEETVFMTFSLYINNVSQNTLAKTAINFMFATTQYLSKASRDRITDTSEKILV